MILLPMSAPASAAELVACLHGLLGRAITVREGTVSAAGAFPALAGLTIDVTGATPLERPAGEWVDRAGGVIGAFSAEALRVVGRPFGSAERAVDLEVTAAACRGEFVDAGGGRVALRLAGAKDGKLRASVSRAAVETIVRIEAAKAARAQGVDIKDVRIAWQGRGSRGLSAEVVLKAKKGFLPAATLRVRGTLEVDGSLTARLSGLSVEGEGMVGSLGAGLIRPKLAKAEGMSRSLLGVPLDGLRITDVRTVVGDNMLTVEGEFEG